MTEGNSQNKRRFEGKVALITGSGRGIGRTIALRMAQEGARVVINFFRNREPAEEAMMMIRELGAEALLVRANVAEEDDLARMIAETEQAFGGLDILINNAANGFNRPVMEQRVKGWDWTMNINARAALFAAQHAAPLMEKRGGGYIINMTSIGAEHVLPDYVVVGASKAALEAVTRYLAVELAPMNISVNAVSAGVVMTEALEHFPQLSSWFDGMEQIKKRIPAGRMVTPEDVAAAVCFLCTPDAQMIRGQILLVDGGFLLKP
ncbi:MAG: enoyl-[acyl-carrier-protein] reductase FabL [Anaerolineae bacterium]|nr:enoyl-[acyl-carrier-protein] reductase FabL [Anaerolineae bacterium]